MARSKPTSINQASRVIGTPAMTNDAGADWNASEGSAYGFFTLETDGTPSPTLRLHDCYARWIAIELALYAKHARPLRISG